MFGSKVGYLAACFFLISPVMLAIYAFQITYDTLACFFSLLTLICFYQFHIKRKSPYLYFAALFGVCMMLSKYTGAVLFFSLVVLTIKSKSYRHFLKNKNTYISLILALVVFIIFYFLNVNQGINPLSFQGAHAFSHFSFANIKFVFAYIASNLLMFNAFFAVQKTIVRS